MGDRCWEHGDGECLGCIKTLEAENARLRKALKQIAETDPEVGDRGGVCAYCDSRLIARRALKERGEE